MPSVQQPIPVFSSTADVKRRINIYPSPKILKYTKSKAKGGKGGCSRCGPPFVSPGKHYLNFDAIA